MPCAAAAAPARGPLLRHKKRFVDVFGGQVRVLSEDPVGRHPVRDHRHYVATGKRRPLMHGTPAMTSGSVVMRS
jgi:hypothetical protein